MQARGETEYLTTMQAAKYLRLNTYMLMKAVDEGRITAYRFSEKGWLWFDQADLDTFLEESRVGRAASLCARKRSARTGRIASWT